jgi:hypothetical protein
MRRNRDFYHGALSVKNGCDSPKSRAVVAVSYCALDTQVLSYSINVKSKGIRNGQAMLESD